MSITNHKHKEVVMILINKNHVKNMQRREFWEAYKLGGAKNIDKVNNTRQKSLEMLNEQFNSYLRSIYPNSRLSNKIKEIKNSHPNGGGEYHKKIRQLLKENIAPLRRGFFAYQKAFDLQPNTEDFNEMIHKYNVPLPRCNLV